MVIEYVYTYFCIIEKPKSSVKKLVLKVRDELVSLNNLTLLSIDFSLYNMYCSEITCWAILQ